MSQLDLDILMLLYASKTLNQNLSLQQRRRTTAQADIRQ